MAGIDRGPSAAADLNSSLEAALPWLGGSVARSSGGGAQGQGASWLGRGYPVRRDGAAEFGSYGGGGALQMAARRPRVRGMQQGWARGARHCPK
jgi:hypothetical protein